MDDIDSIAKAGFESLHMGKVWETTKPAIQNAFLRSVLAIERLAERLRRVRELAPPSLGEHAHAGFSGSHEGWTKFSKDDKGRWQAKSCEPAGICWKFDSGAFLARCWNYSRTLEIGPLRPKGA